MSIVKNILDATGITDNAAPANVVIPTASPVAEPEADPRIDFINEVFDIACTLSPFDWVDRQIRKAQGAVMMLWPVIAPQIDKLFPTLPKDLHGFIDAVLKAVAVATVGTPISGILNIVRGILAAVWGTVGPRAVKNCAAKGIKV